jgi:integrase
MNGLSPSERPKQRNARKVAVLNADALERLVAAGSSQRWRAALALAAFGGLRIGEIRGLRWQDIDLERDSLTVARSLLRDGTPKATKTEAGARTIPLLPALRRRLVEWKLKSPRTDRDEYVIATHDGSPVMERNLARALAAAKTKAGIEAAGDERLSWHSLRHSCASLMATDLELPATTLAALIGHSDASFTMRVYAKDSRDTAAVVEDVLARAASAGIGG